MSSIFDDHNDGEVKEGLLCPICMQDLGTVVQLEQHFETAHSGEDKLILNSLKGLFGKAKKKILRKNSDEEFFDVSSRAGDTFDNSSVDKSINWEPQEQGASVSHTDYFRQVRSSRIDSYVIETNKLLIRLDKLINGNVPRDPRKRKVYEQSIVPWVNDSDVKLCPSCAKTFSIARRRHHCRLCGSVMCTNCSEFIEFSFARKLTNPAFTLSQSSPAVTKLPSTFFSLRRTGSNSSLASMINYTSGEEHIRTCFHCKKFLERRDQQMDLKNSKSSIVLFYEKLKEGTEEAVRLVPVYCKLADSLCQGETNYHLKDAQDLRMKLMKLAETIDVYSKKILMLGVKDDPPPDAKNLRLQKMIRQSTTSFLQERMVGLPKLPNAEELQKLQEARRLVLQKKIQQEKQDALAHQQISPRIVKTISSTSSSPIKNNLPESRPIDVDEGFAAQSVSSKTVSASEEDDPMVQQMRNIRSFIKQAREAHKYDEVELLEANLKLLKEEYLIQMNSKKHTR